MPVKKLLVATLTSIILSPGSVVYKNTSIRMNSKMPRYGECGGGVWDEGFFFSRHKWQENEVFTRKWCFEHWHVLFHAGAEKAKQTVEKGQSRMTSPGQDAGRATGPSSGRDIGPGHYLIVSNLVPWLSSCINGSSVTTDSPDDFIEYAIPMLRICQIF
jgi:hypothetical protein